MFSRPPICITLDKSVSYVGQNKQKNGFEIETDLCMNQLRQAKAKKYLSEQKKYLKFLYKQCNFIKMFCG